MSTGAGNTRSGSSTADKKVRERCWQLVEGAAGGAGALGP